jgi:hypothetical protein
LVEPESGTEPDPDGGSFFESPRLSERSPAALAAMLEEKIKAFLAAGTPR